MKQNKFAAFIITNNRPNRVLTYKSLRDSGYTGPIVLVIDDLDKTRDDYLKNYGDQVVIFDKAAAGAATDKGDNFPGFNAAVFARNACYDIAERLGYTHFVQLDDDYLTFRFRYDKNFDYKTDKACWDLDGVFAAVNRFIDSTTTRSVALCQAGDFIGGSGNQWAQELKLSRKCMNSWFCRTDRRIKFSMRMNDDVTTYVLGNIKGELFFTTFQVAIGPELTQSSAGGMTEIYLESGTYVKTFYAVMAAPSCVKISVIRGQKNSRIHHHVSWNNAAPKIIKQSWKKTA